MEIRIIEFDYNIQSDLQGYIEQELKKLDEEGLGIVDMKINTIKSIYIMTLVCMNRNDIIARNSII